jgi:hypothetical protein
MLAASVLPLGHGNPNPAHEYLPVAFLYPSGVISLRHFSGRGHILF